MTLTIRDIAPADRAGWEALWSAYLAFYKVDLSPDITAHTWTRMMDPASPLKGRLAVEGDQPLGFALHHHHCSTWVMGEDCYLEDLFVAPAARGKGLGRALIEDLVAIGRRNGWRRLYWLTEIENATARKLYDQFCDNDGHIRYRMTL